MSTLDGSFSQPAYLGVGDEYKDPNQGSEIHKPGLKNVVTTVPKTGQTGDNWGSSSRQFIALKGSYLDMNKAEAQYRLEGRNKFLTSNGFRYSSPARTSATPGDYAGSFQKTPYEHVEDGMYKPRGRLQKITDPLEKKNIVTAPLKKGGFGYTGTTLGKPYEYNAGPFEANLERQKEERRRHHELVGERKPFRPGGGRVASLEKRPETAPVGSPKSSLIEEAKQPNNDKEDNSSKTDAKPFKPGGASRGTFPAEMPPEGPEKQPPTAEDEESEGDESRKPFKPSGGPKSKLTRSIQLMTLNIHKV